MVSIKFEYILGTHFTRDKLAAWTNPHHCPIPRQMVIPYRKQVTTYSFLQADGQIIAYAPPAPDPVFCHVSQLHINCGSFCIYVAVRKSICHDQVDISHE